MTDLTKMENAKELIQSVEEEARRLAREQETIEARRPKQLGSGRFMEVMTIQRRKEIININSISEVIPTSRLINGEPVNLTNIIFINGEDITVDHSYNDIRSILKMYFK